MASEEFDPFALSTGLPDKLDFEIQESWFEFDPQYNNGQTLLIKFNVQATDEEFGEHGVGVLMYPCGDGWTAEDRGATAVREDGAVKGFGQGSGYGLWISAALDCDGAETVLREEGRGDPRKAAMWNGTKWHVERKERDYGGEIGKRSRLLPTEFQGVGGGAGTVRKAAGPVKAAATKAAAPVAKAGPVAKAAGPVKKAAPVAAAGFGEGHPLWDTLFSMAFEAADHETFMEQAFSTVAGVSGDAVVEAGVMDNGPDSLWAKAVAAYEAQTQG